MFVSHCASSGTALGADGVGVGDGRGVGVGVGVGVGDGRGVGVGVGVGVGDGLGVGVGDGRGVGVGVGVGLGVGVGEGAGVGKFDCARAFVLSRARSNARRERIAYASVFEQTNPGGTPAIRRGSRSESSAQTRFDPGICSLI
jgi:hypothetical protein